MNITQFKERITLRRSFLVGLILPLVAVYMVIGDRSTPVIMTDFHITPSIVSPGEEFEAIWTYETLRAGCKSSIQRQIIGIKDGKPAAWPFLQVHGVQPPPVGETKTYHTAWKAPFGDAGTTLVLQKRIKRWCNFAQWWLWPMEETHEAELTLRREQF